jgi:transposase InsO family protein
VRKLYSLIKNDVKKLGIKIGRDALFRFLRREHLLILPLKKYTKTTNSKHWLRKYPNLLKELVAFAPEQMLVSDITHLKTKDAVYYLSLVTDVFSRKIMGYKLSHTLATEEVVKALKMAIQHCESTNGIVHHSDRGLQYASANYQDALSEAGMLPSMTDGYDCYQNALAERVNGILKQEFLFTRCNSYEELRLLVKESIHIYNTERPHLSLQMKTPEHVHKKWLQDIRPTAI